MPDHRKAQATVINQTGCRLDSLIVVHKYSDIYKNKMEWHDVADGTSTTPIDIDYHTGPLTTGKDWWYVEWRCGVTRCLINPQNFRPGLDLVDKVAASAGVAGLFVNTETTAGFKQHILRGEDEGFVTQIVLTNDGRVLFKSRSGISETTYKSVHFRK
jgi:hypothetical protein